VAGVLADPAKSQLSELVAALEPVIAVASDKNSLDLDVTKAILELDRRMPGLAIARGAGVGDEVAGF
jgi:hypothetical protein